MRPLVSQAEAEQLAKFLRTGTAEEQEAAYGRIRQLVRRDPQGVKRFFVEHWREAMFDGKRFKEAAWLCQSLVNSIPHDTQLMMELLPWRARGFLYEGGYEKALFIAKGMYNVCPLEQTDAAIQLTIECLKDADPAAIERFQLEQVAGAGRTIAGESIKDKPTVLQAVKMPRSLAETYRRALTQTAAGEDYLTLLGRGNLRLLADRPDEALKTFQDAYQIAPEDRLAEATESIARAMKAQDGGTGRAAAWLSQQKLPTAKPANKP